MNDEQTARYFCLVVYTAFMTYFMMYPSFIIFLYMIPLYKQLLFLLGALSLDRFQTKINKLVCTLSEKMETLFIRSFVLLKYNTFIVIS